MSENKSEVLKKIIGHQQIKFDNGEFSIWNVPSTIMTLNSFLLLEQVGMKKFGKDMKDLIYYLAKRQAYSGTEILHKQFGFKTMTKAVEMELQTSALIGLGVLTTIRYDERKKHAIIKISPNPYTDMSKKILGFVKEPIDNFMRGGCAGIFSYAFGEDMVAIETQCAAMGKPHCIIEIKKPTEWDKNKPEIANQFPQNETQYEDVIKKMTALSMKKK
jgi:hypothetical protein